MEERTGSRKADGPGHHRKPGSPRWSYCDRGGNRDSAYHGDDGMSEYDGETKERKEPGGNKGVRIESQPEAQKSVVKMSNDSLRLVLMDEHRGVPGEDRPWWR